MLCLPNCFLSALPHNPGKQPIVRIQQGTVTGLTDSKYGIDHFFGIPFAKPPTGDLRFAKPVAVEPSPKSDTDATRFGDICMQPSRAEPTLYKVSENCLNLNIVRPQGVAPSFGSTEELSFLVTFPASMLASWCRRVSRLASPLCSSR